MLTGETHRAGFFPQREKLPAFFLSAPYVRKTAGTHGRSFGDNRKASGAPGRSFGDNRKASGAPGQAFGDNRKASGAPGLSFGDNRKASGVPGQAFGDNRKVSGAPGQAFGDDRKASGLNILAGEWWREGGKNKVVLNEEAARLMGLAEPVGSAIRMSVFMSDADSIEAYEVVGVVKDFHTLSLRSRILPTLFIPSNPQAEIVNDNMLYLRVSPGREQEAMQRVNAILPSQDASMAGVLPTPVGELYERLNQSEEAGLKIFSISAAVCLLISLFGIYAAASASTQRRRKEIAIRKVAGATAGSIVRMFLCEYIWLVIVAALVSLPPACLSMHIWLQSYAYRTGVPWWLPAGVIAGAGAVVLSTVLWQVLRAANSNPGEVVKSERG